jgi:hypothetical protein
MKTFSAAPWFFFGLQMILPIDTVSRLLYIDLNQHEDTEMRRLQSSAAAAASKTAPAVESG